MSARLLGTRSVRALVLLIATATPVLWVVLSTRGCVSDGSVVYPRSSPGWVDGAIVVHDVRGSTALMPGDRIMAVEGSSLRQWVTGDVRDVPNRRAGEQLTYLVVREPEGLRPVTVTLAHYSLAAAVRANILVIMIPVAAMVVAAAVYWHRPRQPVARLMVAAATLLPVYSTAWPLGLSVVDLAGGCGVWRYVVGDLAAVGFWSTLLHIALLFPTEHPAVRRHRWLPLAAYALPFALFGTRLLVTYSTTSDPLARLEQRLLVSAGAALVVPVVVAALMVAAHLRTRDQSIHAPVRMMAGSFVAAWLLFVVLGQIPALLGRSVPWDRIVPLLLPIPVAVGLAVLRYRLLDVEVIVRRSVVHAVLAVAVSLLSLTAVVLLTALSPVDIVGREPLAAAVVASIVTAVCLNPLHGSLRRIISRHLFGARDDPFDVVSRVGRVSTAREPDDVIQDLVGVLADALRLPYAELHVTAGHGLEIVGRRGDPVRQPLELPLTHAGQPVGRLLLGQAPGQEPFGAADSRLLEALAMEVGSVAHATLLAEALQRARERLVTAREEERRRLRRDLHDGVGPTLAAALMQLQAARALDAAEPAPASQALESAIRHALADLRSIVDDLRPPSLDELGLVEAIREQVTRFAGTPPGSPARGGPRVEVRAAGCLTGLPAAVEVAAFRIALEAVTNAARHADASTIEVRLHGGDDLQVEVRDDGSGPDSRTGADHRLGVGLESMAERAAELGGTCAVSRGATGGTVVHARLPL